MDDLEEFRQIFFQECYELLQILEESLCAIENGHHTKDTINAAFRAIHSIKGGAGAFGFDGMVCFCHNFESVLDNIRNDKIELSPHIIKLTLRAKDIVTDLVTAAQNNLPNIEMIGRDILSELEATLSEGKVSVSNIIASTESSPLVQEEKVKIIDDVDNIDDAYEEEIMRDVIILFEPEKDMIRAAIDPLQIIDNLSELGSLNVTVINNDIPPLEEFVMECCYLNWKFTLYTSASLETIEDIFFFAKEYAKITYEDTSIQDAVPTEDIALTEDTALTVEDNIDDVPQSVVQVPSPKIVPSNDSNDMPAPPQAAPESTSVVLQKNPVTLRVDLLRIDRLVNMVGETVITQSVLAQQASSLSAEQHGGLLHAIESLSRQTRELQESVMAIRAQPVKNVFQRMNRLVRELSMELKKEVKLVIVGEQTEVDTTVIEELSDPLMHMIRNSMDHGIEMPDEREENGKPREGTIKLSAEHRSGRIVITITDDGRGINREKVLSIALQKGLIPEDAKPTIEEIENMIFLPGFSTADHISNVSGRGVGMDVVRRNIQALGGRVFITSTPKRGTIFTMALPLTLAVLDGMVIRVGSENYIIPITSIVEASRIENKELNVLPNGTYVINMRGHYIRIINLGNALSVPLLNNDPQIIIVETENFGQVGLLVDDLIGQQQIVIKSLETHYSRVDGISGATILGDGKVALILDTDAIAAMNLGGGSQAHFPIHQYNNIQE